MKICIYCDLLILTIKLRPARPLVPPLVTTLTCQSKDLTSAMRLDLPPPPPNVDLDL